MVCADWLLSFAPQSDMVSIDQQPILAQIITQADQQPTQSIDIIGYAADTQEKNLADERAATVANLCLSNGIARDRLLLQTELNWQQRNSVRITMKLPS